MFSRMLSNVCAAVDQSECQHAARILMDAFPGVAENRLVAAVFGAGVTLHSQEKLEEAEKHYRLAIALYEKCFPDCHTDAVCAVRQLLSVLDELGRQEEANGLREGLLTIINRANKASARQTVLETA